MTIGAIVPTALRRKGWVAEPSDGGIEIELNHAGMLAVIQPQFGVVFRIKERVVDDVAVLVLRFGIKSASLFLTA